MFTINKILTLPRTNAAYKLSPRTVYYIENHYDEDVNDFIIDNYEDIISAFASMGYEFVYFPLLFQSFKALDLWFSPDTSRAWRHILGNRYETHIPCSGFVIPVGDEHNSSFICRFQNINVCESVKDLILRITSGKPLSPPTSSSFQRHFASLWGYSAREEKYLRDEERAKYELYSILEYQHRYFNRAYDYYSMEQAEEVDKMLEKMQKLGISRQLLIQILKDGEKKDFVQMIVTDSYNIILENLHWCNKEVDLPPLHRAIYLLYLKHEEGINIKDLVDYQDELFEIYKKLSKGLDTETQRERVMKVTDPFDNRINTIFSFIRRTFGQVLQSPSIANYYSITGMRGQNRKIELNRRYVTWVRTL